MVAGVGLHRHGWPTRLNNLIVIMSSFVLLLHSLDKHFINPDLRVRKSVMR